MASLVQTKYYFSTTKYLISSVFLETTSNKKIWLFFFSSKRCNAPKFMRDFQGYYEAVKLYSLFKNVTIMLKTIFT